ncbi:MAG: MBL fold metallo-hydrolase, partial [Acidobacteriota bacterium]
MKAILAFVILLFVFNNAQSEPIRVTLLGTGGPPPVIERFGPGTLVQAGGENLLFDVGRGAIQRLFQMKVPLKEVHAVFLTHLHSDHIVGIPDLYLTGWVNGRREVPFRVWAPPGTKDMMTHMEKAFDFDIRIRLYDDLAAPEGILVQAHDIKEGIVYERNGVKVTAFEVDHRPIKPAFGYRIDYDGHSVVISGDTRASENLIRYSEGVDVLIHEVAVPESLIRAHYDSERMKTILNHHTMPEEAGELFHKIQPKLAVFSHVILPSATKEEVIAPTRKKFSGRVELGEDLMVIEIGE